MKRAGISFLVGTIKRLCGLVALGALMLGCGGGSVYIPGDGRDREVWALAGGQDGRAYRAVGIEPPLRLLWQQKTDGPPLEGVLFTGRLVVQQTTAPSLYAFDRYSGQLLGKRGGSTPLCGPPTLAGELLAYGELGGKPHLRAFDRQRRKVRWSYAGVVCAPVVGWGDTLLVALEAGQLVALAGADGAELWESEIGGLLQMAPSVADGRVYIGSAAGELTALDLDSGEEQWRCDLDSGVRTRPAVEGGYAYVGTADGAIQAVRLDSGRVEWRRGLGALMAGGLALTPTVVVAGSVDHSIYGLGRDSGDRLWKFTTQGVVRSAPAVAGETVYCGSADEHFYALDSTSGRLLWKYRLDGPALRPVALGERMVGIATEEGTVYVFGR